MSKNVNNEELVSSSNQIFWFFQAGSQLVGIDVAITRDFLVSLCGIMDLICFGLPKS